VKIGFLTELFPPSLGGQEQRFSGLADQLATQGHQVTVMCVRHSAQIATHETLSNGVVVIRRPTIRHYYKPLGGLVPRSPFGMVQYALAARRLTQTHEFDVIFLNQWPLLHILTLPRRYRACAIVDWCEVRHSATFRILQRILPKLVAANTAVSTQVAQHIRIFARGPVLILPSGITTARYRMDPVNRRRGLLYLGRITPHKNLPLLMDAFEELCRRGYAEPLLIAGEGPAFEAMRRRAQSSPYASRIELLGLVSDDRKCQLLASAKLLVMTSQREGFPRVVAEAIASGLPVVTARYPQNGTASVVEEFQCGLCTDPTASSLANAAQVILSDWEAWSARARAQTCRLDWSYLARQFEALLKETAAGARTVSLAYETQGAS
jgi:glycosyltransferase involved in cell wall biosynthesis